MSNDMWKNDPDARLRGSFFPKYSPPIYTEQASLARIRLLKTVFRRNNRQNDDLFSSLPGDLPEPESGTESCEEPKTFFSVDPIGGGYAILI